LAAIAAWSFLSMSDHPMPSAWISMSLWSLWKSSTMAFTAARVAGLGSVSHIVTTIFFCALAGRALPTSEVAAAPAVAAPSRAKNSRRPRIPSRCSATNCRKPGSLSQRFMLFLLSRSLHGQKPGAGRFVRGWPGVA
jgi:hypothetical protein